MLSGLGCSLFGSWLLLQVQVATDGDVVSLLARGLLTLMLTLLSGLLCFFSYFAGSVSCWPVEADRESRS